MRIWRCRLELATKSLSEWFLLYVLIIICLGVWLFRRGAWRRTWPRLRAAPGWDLPASNRKFVGGLGRLDFATQVICSGFEKRNVGALTADRPPLRCTSRGLSKTLWSSSAAAQLSPDLPTNVDLQLVNLIRLNCYNIVCIFRGWGNYQWLEQGTRDRPLLTNPVAWLEGNCWTPWLHHTSPRRGACTALCAEPRRCKISESLRSAEL